MNVPCFFVPAVDALAFRSFTDAGSTDAMRGLSIKKKNYLVGEHTLTGSLGGSFLWRHERRCNMANEDSGKNEKAKVQMTSLINLKLLSNQIPHHPT